jgi:hypothetical protein
MVGLMYKILAYPLMKPQRQIAPSSPPHCFLDPKKTYTHPFIPFQTLLAGCKPVLQNSAEEFIFCY